VSFAIPLDETPADFRIGLKPVPLEDWFERGEADPAVRKDSLLAAHPGLVWAELAGSRQAQQEVFDLVAAWLHEPPDTEGLPPLLAAARMVPDDLCLMEPRGAWTLTALSLCAGTFFTADHVIGKALHQLHAPVPGFGERFAARVSRIFDRLAQDTILERRNWTLLNSDALFLPDPAAMRAGIAALTPAQAGRELFIRVERQTVRRLPATGAVLFTIRVWREPLEVILGQPERREAFARAWSEVMSEAGRAFRDYKRLDIYDPLVRGLLEAT
jgi:hypothetical protein